MKQQTFWLVSLSLGLVLLAGCSTAPVIVGPAPVAPRVEEGVRVPFEEVMAAVPVEGAHQVYQNMHIGILATVNPRAGVNYNALQVAALLRKLEPRVEAATLQVVTDCGTVSPRRVSAVREAVAAKIDEVVAQTLRTWEHAQHYEVEVTVTSMYFTDSTVGRGGKDGRAL